MVTGLERRFEPIKRVRRQHDAKESGVALRLPPQRSGRAEKAIILAGT